MPSEPGFLPGQRLWTPWRMAYVGGSQRSDDCVFCRAVEASDDVASLIVHRGKDCFVILNLFPYNTGHLMVVPNDHVDDPANMESNARAEMAELTASFCTGLKTVMGCDGFNTGMNLGSAAGAGIADHLHHHIVPRWVGDANFMPLIGGTKVLPEQIPATYAKVRAELARQADPNAAVTLVVETDRGDIVLEGDRLPRVLLSGTEPVWKQARAWLAGACAQFDLLGWAGAASVSGAAANRSILAYRTADQTLDDKRLRLVPRNVARSVLTGFEGVAISMAGERFPPMAPTFPTSGTL